jgi:glycosyltransferase involved in cell wall biosynthesis
MIVKDEAQTLPRCLDSIAGAVDELVVVDTGSTDGTPEVARRYTDRVLAFAWCDDFAAARQFAFDQAIGDWVCWLDADDVVHGAGAIRSLVDVAPPHVGGFSWRYVYGRDARGNVACEFWRERCVRHDGSYRWTGRVHEVLVACRPSELQRSDAVYVEHNSPPDRSVVKNRRNLDLLEREYAACGDRPSARLLFYLGREYADAGRLDEAVAMLTRCVRESSWDEERYLAQLQIADLHRRRACFTASIDADLHALTICPHWSQAYFDLAQTYYYLRDWHKVVHWTDVGRAMPAPDSSHFVDPAAIGYRWIIFYTNALYHVGAVAEAQRWTRRALALCPDDEQHLANLGYFAADLVGRRVGDAP